MAETTGTYLDGKHEIQKPIDEVVEIYRDNPSLVYSESFFGNMVKLRGWQREYGGKLVKALDAKSVIDFGCGAGYYLEGAWAQGASIQGYEYLYEQAKPYIPDSIFNFVSFGNVMEDIVPPFKADIVISIEVAEHILPEKSKVMVHNITSCSKEYVVFSAAPPGQTGCGHINLKPWSFWEELFEEYGFGYNYDATDKVRKIYRGLNKTSKYINLLSRMVRVFVKKERGEG